MVRNLEHMGGGKESSISRPEPRIRYGMDSGKKVGIHVSNAQSVQWRFIDQPQYGICGGNRQPGHFHQERQRSSTIPEISQCDFTNNPWVQDNGSRLQQVNQPGLTLPEVIDVSTCRRIDVSTYRRIDVSTRITPIRPAGVGCRSGLAHFRRAWRDAGRFRAR